MQIISQISDLNRLIKKWRLSGQTIGLVPTMGSLHDGHLRLVEMARKDSDKVVVSIFVNPTQFAPTEDFDQYPRDIDSDRVKLEKYSPDLIFTPTTQAIYPKGAASTRVCPSESLSQILCGKSRPHFFDGVAQVCSILFNIVQPDFAYFGEKDRQQLVIIRRMVRDLHFPIIIINVPTERDVHGLALSSRNSYLSEEQRIFASELFKTMSRVKSQILAGNQDYAYLCNRAIEHLTNMGFVVDYFELRNSIDLSEDLQANRCIFAAANLEATRLIDNLLVDAEPATPIPVSYNIDSQATELLFF
ncbi:pantothenate synthetase-like [Brevipalpus obovatus]|uniref:pantothenate synthetase-like n=1 Tax=Brevipalpus obovatus TaxID=246614 RepID=UPI003D9EBE21